MFIRGVCLTLVLLAAIPAFSQLGVTPYTTPDAPAVDAPMLTPPPVSGQPYPSTVGDEVRSNYLSAGLNASAAHDDNVLEGSGGAPVNDVIYSIFPTVTLNQITPRQQRTLTYSPGFTFYQNTRALNDISHNANLTFEFKLSPHVAILLRDSFQKSSNIFEQPYPLSGATISGSSQSSPIAVVAPYADHLNNTTNASISYQFSRNAMIGSSGIITFSNYPHPTQAFGLYNSTSVGGSAFYIHRLSKSQYIGITSQYLNSHSNPVDARTTPNSSQIDVQTYALLPFYTIYLSPTVSLSASIGPEHYKATQDFSPSAISWEPYAMASVGWQKSRTNLVASYSRSVAGGVGLPGAFQSDSANALARWQIANTWAVELTGNYAIYKDLTPLFSSSTQNGHAISASASVQHTIGERVKLSLQYARLHQNFSGVQVISENPDSNRESISVSYQFSRPLGR